MRLSYRNEVKARKLHMFSISGRLNRTKQLVGIGVLLATVLVVSMGLLMNVHTAKAAQICNTSGMISMGKYWLNSNEWGASNGSGTQCIWDTSTTSQTLDLKDFLNYLVSRGLSSSKYLSSVESGTEIFTGNGQLDTTSYYANVVTEGSTPTPTPGTTPTPRPTSTPGSGGGFNPNPNPHYRIVNRNSGQVLDVSGASTANGAAVLEWPSTGETNQQWSLVQVS